MALCGWLVTCLAHQGIDPMVAVERLKRFNKELEIRDRKYNLYQVRSCLLCSPTHVHHPPLPH